ncbi:substrate-binding domain of hmg-CoA reductase [Aspergillus brunneoviolaceus CBS 621.78]|uniref:Substrate-binding domain of hmg-CoA reductase n=1 Tax=Aspergillus brunneoviolaceus CBS 621.78 TaxID=1450534 RepID=A0ACD1G2W7_9EURO|nr:substrate-binding domain of hmg-CoA reductase [Aspergillus brunneoviolaceus CBS 621.78]RAH43504.1 substrate-binding domain of hmg-CoA reductase [Aspergillus brunneoviolaceus CBS 621.78]
MAPPSKQMSETIRPYLEDVKHITDHDAKPSQIQIENFIGYTRVPVGLAGPLNIRTPDGEIFKICAPMATTEAALIASCSRGCKALNASGGVEYILGREGMSRGPAFLFVNPREAQNFIDILSYVENTLSEVAELTSNHLKLVSITPHLIGCYAHVVFNYTCGDAAGQNMVSIATQRCCVWLMETYAAQYKIKRFYVDGQMSSEKKPSWGNVVTPRGVEVTAWACLPGETCQEVLSCSAADLHDILHMAQDGCIRNGIHGSNIDTVNVLTSVFIATGQDAASVTDASWSHGSSFYDRARNSITVSMYFPSIPVGVVGGGTVYDTQREALEIMQCAGSEKKRQFAGFLACFALGLELSTAASVVTDTFAHAHQKLRKGESAKL